MAGVGRDGVTISKEKVGMKVKVDSKSSEGEAERKEIKSLCNVYK